MKLEVTDLTVRFDRGDYAVRALDSLSFNAADGELVLLLGPSGCGKTTLLSCLAGILTPTSGRIAFDDTEVTALSGAALDRYRRSTVGIVFQAFNLIGSLTALENVAAPLRLAGQHARAARARARELLDLVSMSERLDHKPSDLSGGQQQRVAIARGLVMDPPLLIADEPTAHLDYVQVEGILSLLRRLAAPGRIIVVATHDDRLVPIADRVIELAPRFGVPSRPPEEVQLAAREILFNEGDKADLVYFVETGAVEIVRGDEVVATIESGEYFGELGPLMGFPRTASARAKVATTLTGYALQDFKERAALDPSVGKLLGAVGRAGGPPPAVRPKAKPRAKRTRAPAAKRKPSARRPRSS